MADHGLQDNPARLVVRPAGRHGVKPVPAWALAVLAGAALAAGSALVSATPALAQSTASAPAEPSGVADPEADAEDPAVDPLTDVLDKLEAAFPGSEALSASLGPSPAAMSALEDSLKALLAEAEAAGDSQNLVERRLVFAAAKRFGKDIPGPFRTERGMLDAEVLLHVVGNRAAPAESGGQTYLTSIQREGARTEISSAIREPERTAATQPASTALTTEPEPEPTPESTVAEGREVVVEGSTRFVVVQQGDSLGRIAEEVYGNMLAYNRIYVANRDLISNPNLLQPGMRLRLPD